MIYFVSGHGDLTQEEFDKYYLPIITDIISTDEDAQFIVGDYKGCDTLTIEFLTTWFPRRKLSIYHIGEKSRVIVTTDDGESSVTRAKNVHYIGGFKSDEERDAAMTAASDDDICYVRLGKEISGTGRNLLRRAAILPSTEDILSIPLEKRLRYIMKRSNNFTNNEIKFICQSLR